MMHLAEHLVLFVRTLRVQGVSVRAGGTLDAARALDLVGVRRRDDVRDALRAVLVSRHDDLARFDRVFDRFWRVWPAAGGSGLPQPIQPPRRGVTTVQWQASASIPPEERRISPLTARRRRPARAPRSRGWSGRPAIA